MNIHIIKISFTFQRIRNELHFWHCEDMFIAKIHLNGLRINIQMKWQSDNLLASFLFVVRKLLSGQTSEPYPGFPPSLLTAHFLCLGTLLLSLMVVLCNYSHVGLLCWPLASALQHSVPHFSYGGWKLSLTAGLFPWPRRGRWFPLLVGRCWEVNRVVADGFLHQRVHFLTRVCFIPYWT